jgi:hypothetical protein
LPIAEHWNGKAWSQVAMPKGVNSHVVAASAPAASDSIAPQLTGVVAVSGAFLSLSSGANLFKSRECAEVYASCVTKNSSRLAVFAMVSAAVLALSVALPAQAATPGWRQVFSKHYGPPRNAFGAYDTIVAFTRSDAWAFGGTDLAGGGRSVAVHWNGRNWSPTTLPRAATDVVAAASAPAPDDIWAVTRYGGYILHWNGRAWSVAKRLHVPKSPYGAPHLTGVVAVSAKDVWVFGSSGFIPGLGTWHYNGKSWSQWHGTATNITDGSAVSAANIWAVGVLGASSTIVHYTGTWQLVNDKVLSGLQIDGIHAFSATNVWATADNPAKESGSWLLHYNGHAWSKFKTPWNVTPEWDAIAADGHGGLWLGAFAFAASGEQFYEVHRSFGAWSRVRVSAILFSLAHAPGTASVWGAGISSENAGSNAVIWADGKI